ncbi:glycoside hydrolase [Hesseltinella vesiculosa]|uniref:chitinase n=1 Tax=Hesseltinella vesiculosa TaxID=101127 RepID=A0A1X2GU59_9FUNG|nr:glycoside hydrolase [Hesseltinella vesiculosa]
MLASALFLLALQALQLHANSIQPRKYHPDQFNNLVLYWGQGGDEKPMAKYCDKKGVSIIVVGFVHDYTGGPNGTPQMDLASHCMDTSHCPDIGKDIAYCQDKGIKVTLSLGGAGGPYHDQDWKPDDLAWNLWNMFLGGTDKSFNRPFGKGVKLDGIDLDPEATSPKGYDKLIHRLRTLYHLDHNKKYMISAAPQCADLKDYDGNAVYNILHPKKDLDAYPDMVFVQFYNNKCSAAAFSKKSRWDASDEGSFNFDEWENWAAGTPNTKVYLGLIGKDTHYDTGYVEFDTLTSILDDIHDKHHFGGVMIWNAEIAYTNPVTDGSQYGEAVANYLDYLQSPSKLMRIADTIAPVLTPIIDPTISPLPCESGVMFSLMNKISLRNLVRYFEHSVQRLATLEQAYPEEMDQPLMIGSSLCLGPVKSNQITLDYFGLKFIHNTTILP